MPVSDLTLSQTPSWKNITRHLLLGLSGSAIVLALLFYAVSKSDQNIDPSMIMKGITDSSIYLFLLYIILSLIGTFFRAVRYRILIKAAGEDEASTPDMKSLFLITAVRGMVVDLLPARLGELIYIALVKKISGTSVHRGLTSLVFAMVLDVAVLAPIALILVLFIGFPNNAPLKVALVAIVIVVMFYCGVRFALPWIAKLIRKITPSNQGILGKLLGLLEQLFDAVESTVKAKVLGKVLALSVLVRGLKYAGLLILFHGVVANSFPALLEFGNLEVMAAMIASEMTAALPIPTLMSFGAWEIGGMTFMSFLGAPPTDTLIALIVVHILTQTVDYSLGLVALFMVLTQVNPITKPINASTHSSTIKRWGIALVLSIVSLALLIGGWKAYQSEKEKNDQRLNINHYENIEKPAWFNQLSGLIVWSSNRMGNHNIMMMSLPDMRVTPLTTHPHTETHPRVSPDGKQVVFSRSHKPWQSWRSQRPWDIVIKNIKTEKEIRIPNGISPTWSEDGKQVFFYRHRGEMWSYNIESEKEIKIAQTSLGEIEGQELFWPSINPSGQMAVAYRDHGRPRNIITNSNILDPNANGDITHIADGCMITWSPSADFAFFVSNDEGGKQKNQFNRYDPVSGEITKWLDLPGEHSHEYFPRLDPSEQYLVFAASSGGHEPDIEDYEIFLWKTDTDNAEAMRLTFDGGNDSWPDIYIK